MPALSSIISTGCGDQKNLQPVNIQQIQAMQNGLIQHTLESMATMQATHARNTAQYQAEQAALERLQLQAIQGAMGSATPPPFTPQGAFHRFSW
jgi:hypothetical protein